MSAPKIHSVVAALLMRVAQKLWKGVFTRPEEDRVSVRGCFIRQRRNVQATERNVRSRAR